MSNLQASLATPKEAASTKLIVRHPLFNSVILAKASIHLYSGTSILPKYRCPPAWGMTNLKDEKQFPKE